MGYVLVHYNLSYLWQHLGFVDFDTLLMILVEAFVLRQIDENITPRCWSLKRERPVKFEEVGIFSVKLFSK